MIRRALNREESPTSNEQNQEREVLLTEFETSPEDVNYRRSDSPPMNLFWLRSEEQSFFDSSTRSNEGLVDEDLSKKDGLPYIRSILRYSNVQRKTHRLVKSQSIVEYPPGALHIQGDESTPLIRRFSSFQATSQSCFREILEEEELGAKFFEIAAIFLTDFIRERQQTLPSDLKSITYRMIKIHKVRYSVVWTILTRLATMALFLSSHFEGDSSLLIAYALNIFSVFVFAADLAMLSALKCDFQVWTNSMILLLSGICIEMLFTGITGIRGRFQISSAVKPIAIFYLSEKARNAFEALKRIVPFVARVLTLELFLILSFAAVACRLYSDFESFQNLQTSWLSLFQLSTTVVNPSMWMPMYKDSPKNAFFFIAFDTATTLYFHSLVLSVVVQTYIHASTEIYERSITKYEEVIRLAFESLKRGAVTKDIYGNGVPVENIKEVLQLVRPHYSNMKIDALVKIINPSGDQFIDYPVFRTKIRRVLNTSIRSAPTCNVFDVIIEAIAAFVAVTNFVYVILLTSEFQADWFDVITFPAGITITLLGIMELIVRANPFRLVSFTPITRLNGTFDGLAALAAVVSCWGIFHYTDQLELMVTGRSIDMTRIMRYHNMFRRIVQHSGVVITALLGPLALVLSMHHLFTYMGMLIWTNTVIIGSNVDKITPLYDLNNFNSYYEGLVTMFQVLIVNDWHAIAEVFLNASKHSSPFIVYPFFIGANLISVNILLNCLTAFFVGAFVTKLDNQEELFEEDDDETKDVSKSTTLRKSNFIIDTHSEQPLRRVASNQALNEGDNACEFEVFERQGFDIVMRTVAGGLVDDDDDIVSKEICKMLKTFERLAGGQMKVGYLVSCQQTMNRFGNLRFQKLSKDFVEADEMHTIINEMHATLVSPTANYNSGSVVRILSQRDRCLHISASLVREKPSISMFVAWVETNPEK